MVKRASADGRAATTSDGAAVLRKLRKLWESVPGWPEEAWCEKDVFIDSDAVELRAAAKEVEKGRADRVAACEPFLAELRTCYNNSRPVIVGLQWRHLAEPQRRRSQNDLHGHFSELDYSRVPWGVPGEGKAPEHLALEAYLGCGYQCAECVNLALRTLAELEAKLHPPSEPPPINDTALNAPQLRTGQLPAMVLVTLLQAGGRFDRRELVKLPGARGSDRPRIANLCTPKGDLASRALIAILPPSIALTEAGRAEAAIQRWLGTKSLLQA